MRMSVHWQAAVPLLAQPFITHLRCAVSRQSSTRYLRGAVQRSVTGQWQAQCAYAPAVSGERCLRKWR